MKKTILLPLLLIFFSACAGTRPEIRLTSEPSIERAFDLISATRQGKPLMKFLYEHPVLFEYSNTAGVCHKFNLNRGLIFLPVEMRGSDLVLALALARAADIYRLGTITGMEEIVSEEEELSALFQARLGVEIGLTTEDFKKAPGAAEIRHDFCAYVMETSRHAMAEARIRALSTDPDCQRPLDTLASQRIWLEKMRQAMNDDTFQQLLYERDLQRVHRGVMTMPEAMKNDARIRALPSYETFRYQRTFYDTQAVIFTDFDKAIKRELAEDESWRAAHKEELEKTRADFVECNMAK